MLVHRCGEILSCEVREGAGGLPCLLESSGVIPRRVLRRFSRAKREGAGGSSVKQAKPARRELCPVVLPNIIEHC